MPCRKMIYRTILILFNGRRRIAVVLGVCLVLTITFILKSINYDISLSSRHVITFQANITHGDNKNGGFRTTDRTLGRECNTTTQKMTVKKKNNSITRSSKSKTISFSKVLTSKPSIHHSADKMVEDIKKYNKLNNGFYPQEILAHTQQHKIEIPPQKQIYERVGINMLKQNQVLSQNEMVVHDLQQPNILKSFTTEETQLQPTKHMDELKEENHLTNKLIFQRQIPKNEVGVGQRKEFSNYLIGNDLFHRLQDIQSINMRNQESLSRNNLLFQDNFINKDLDIPVPISRDTITEKRGNDVTSKASRANEVRYMFGHTHPIPTDADFRGDSPVPGRRITVHSILQHQPAKPSRDKTQGNYNCENPRKVPKVENILCMDRPKFLPNYKNPCWRDTVTGNLRCLPYFHIFGTCKSGTTDLFHRMVYHPQIIPNNGILSKETWFWSWKRYDRMIGTPQNQTIPDHAMTLNTFTDFFDAKMIDSFMTNVNGHSPYHPLVTGHGDPMDIWDFTRWPMISQNMPMAQEPEVTTPYLVRHVNPNIKLIALLREPAERTYSHYLHTQSGDNKESFHFHVVQTIKYLRNCESVGQLRACVYKPGLRMKAPLHASLYYLHLTEWLKVFPRNQILLLTNDDYQRDTAGTLSTVFRFLNLDPMPYSDLIKVASRQKQYVSPLKARLGAMLPETKAILGKYFEDSIHKLVALLNDTKYLKWIDNSSTSFDMYSTNPDSFKRSYDPYADLSANNLRQNKLPRTFLFNNRNDGKPRVNINSRDGLFIKSLRGLKLPSNDIPRADLSRDIIHEFQLQSNSSIISNVKTSDKYYNTPSSMGVPSYRMYKVKIPSKHLQMAKSVTRSSSNKLSGVKLSSDNIKHKKNINLFKNVKPKNISPTTKRVHNMKHHSHRKSNVKFSPNIRPGNLLKIPSNNQRNVLH